MRLYGHLYRHTGGGSVGDRQPGAITSCVSVWVQSAVSNSQRQLPCTQLHHVIRAIERRSGRCAPAMAAVAVVNAPLRDFTRWPLLLLDHEGGHTTCAAKAPAEAQRRQEGCSRPAGVSLSCLMRARVLQRRKCRPEHTAPAPSFACRVPIPTVSPLWVWRGSRREGDGVARPRAHARRTSGERPALMRQSSVI